MRRILIGCVAALLVGTALLAAQGPGPLFQALYKVAGGVARTLFSKLSDVVSVKDYGCVGDGVTNDTACVAAAYAATASTGAFPGAAIYFPAPAVSYKFNLTIARSGVRIYGAGRCRISDTTPVGGSMFIPADLTLPVIQVGDGTSQVEKTTIEHFCMRGDGTFSVAGTSTSDGIKIKGAYNTSILDFEIGQFGGKCSYVTSSASRASAYNYFDNGTFMSCSRYGALVDYGSDFTTATYFRGVNWSPSNIGSGDYGLRVEGSTVFVSDSWIQALDGHAHLYLLKDAGGRPPAVEFTNVTIDTGGNPTWTPIDIDLAGGAHGYIGAYIQGRPWYVDGKIRWDDGTSYDGSGTNAVTPSLRFTDAKIQNHLYFDIAAAAGVSVFNDANTPSMVLRGNERVAAGGVTYLELSGGSLRTPGVFSQNLQFGSVGAMWRNATTGRMHYLQTAAFAGNDVDGTPFTPWRKAVTYSASMTPVVDQGSWFYIAATNGTAFTINAPTVNAFTTANLAGSRITITVSNQSGGALGAVTWNAAYKLTGGATWSFPPATGFSRSVDFIYDATNWIMVGRTDADVPN